MCNNGKFGSCDYNAKPWFDTPRICLNPDSPNFMTPCEDEPDERRMDTTSENATNSCSTCD